MTLLAQFIRVPGVPGEVEDDAIQLDVETDGSNQVQASITVPAGLSGSALAVMVVSQAELLSIEEGELGFSPRIDGVKVPEQPDATFGLIDFGIDNAGRYYTIQHGDALDCIASTGWAWGCFTRLDQNAGSISQYILSSGATNANPSFNWFIREASVGTPNTYESNVSDAGGDFAAQGAQDLVTLGQLRLVVLQYNPSSGNMELYICDPGGSANLVATATGPDGDVIAPIDWNFGRRSATPVDRYFQEHAGGLWKADRALTAQEIEAIANGASPGETLGEDLAGWWPFLGGPVQVEPDLSGNGNDATRQGTGWDLGDVLYGYAHVLGAPAEGGHTVTLTFADACTPAVFLAVLRNVDPESAVGYAIEPSRDVSEDATLEIFPSENYSTSIDFVVSLDAVTLVKVRGQTTISLVTGVPTAGASYKNDLNKAVRQKTTWRLDGQTARLMHVCLLFESGLSALPPVEPPPTLANVAIWPFNAASGAVAADSVGTADGAISGSMEYGVPDLVDGADTCMAGNGVDAKVLVPHDAAHELASYVFDFVMQPDTTLGASEQEVWAAKDQSASGTRPPGGFSIERFANRLRGYTRNEGSGAVWLEEGATPDGNHGVADLPADDAVLIHLVCDPNHATEKTRLYLEGAKVAYSGNGQGIDLNTVPWSFFCFRVAEGSHAAFADGPMYRPRLREGVMSDAEVAAEVAAEPAVSIIRSSDPIALSDTFGAFAGGSVTELDVLANDQNLTGMVISGLTQPSAGSVAIVNNGTAGAAINFTAPSPINTTEYEFEYSVDGSAPTTVRVTVLGSGSPPPPGEYTPSDFVVPPSGRVQPTIDHTGVKTHGEFDPVNPKSKARICPMSGLSFWRITGDPGTPVKIFGDQTVGNLIWSKYNTVENACSTGRNFNANASMTGFWEQKSVSGNPSGNLLECAIIDITGEHGGQPWQLIRASGDPGFGEVKPVSTIWDPLDKYSMYEGKADGMYRYWPIGRPAGGNYPPSGTPGFERGTQARAVGEKVKLFNWPVSGTTKQDQPRGGRMNLSNNGEWYFVPCKRTSDGQWGGYRCNVWTGQAGGPFVVNPDPGGDPNSTNNAIGKTSSLGRLGSFQFQSIDGSKQDTNHARFFDMTNGQFISERKEVAGGHSHWFNLNGVDYFVGKVGGTGGFGGAWSAYNPLTDTVYRVSDSGNGVQHLMGMNIHDKYENYPVPGGSPSGQRYIFASTHASTGSPRDDGVIAFRFELNNPNLKRYMVHTRGTRHENSNNAEVHPQISHDSRIMTWNSNWLVPGVETDGNLIHTYAMEIPDAFWSPNNDGS